MSATEVQPKSVEQQSFTVFGSRKAAVGMVVLALAMLAAATAIVLNAREVNCNKFSIPLPSEDILKGVVYGTGGILAATTIYVGVKEIIDHTQKERERIMLAVYEETPEKEPTRALGRALSAAAATDFVSDEPPVSAAKPYSTLPGKPPSGTTHFYDPTTTQ